MKRLFEIKIIILITTHLTLAVEGTIFDDILDRIALLHAAPITGVTVPGTKWCGPGNTSRNYNDLGSQRETDKCCRDHDYCDEILEPHTTLHGLKNTDRLPILKCSCERKFVNCLNAVNNIVSYTIGRLYYRARSVCIDEGYPIIGCKQYMMVKFHKRCIRYNVNKKKQKIWQFYDMPFYT